MHFKTKLPSNAPYQTARPLVKQQQEGTAARPVLTRLAAGRAHHRSGPGSDGRHTPGKTSCPSFAITGIATINQKSNKTTSMKLLLRP